MDNYEKAKHRGEELFLQYDQEKMIRKFGLRFDDDFLYVDDFLRRDYRVNRATGVFEWSVDGETWQEAAFNDAMTLYDILCFSEDDCHPSGEYSQVPNLVRVSGRNNMFAGQGIFKEMSEKWADRMDALDRACRSMGGIPAAKGDLAYLIPMYQGLNILVRFYEADDEFPPCRIS